MFLLICIRFSKNALYRHNTSKLTWNSILRGFQLYFTRSIFVKSFFQGKNQNHNHLDKGTLFVRNGKNLKLLTTFRFFCACKIIWFLTNIFTLLVSINLSQKQNASPCGTQLVHSRFFFLFQTKKLL